MFLYPWNQVLVRNIEISSFTYICTICQWLLPGDFWCKRDQKYRSLRPVNWSDSAKSSLSYSNVGCCISALALDSIQDLSYTNVSVATPSRCSPDFANLAVKMLSVRLLRGRTAATQIASILENWCRTHVQLNEGWKKPSAAFLPVPSEISDLRNFWLRPICACAEYYFTFQIRWENWLLCLGFGVWVRVSG